MTTIQAAQPAASSGETRPLIRTVLTVLGFGILILFSFIQIAPFVLTVANSFKCDPAITSAPGAFIPVPPFGVGCEVIDESGAVVGRLTADQQTEGATFNPSLSGYQRILQSSGSSDLPRWFLNTVFYAVAVTILRLIFDSMAGYALARIKFAGNRALFFIILGTLMIPAVVMLIPRFLMLYQMGLLNTYQGYIFVLAADAFGIMLMKQFFETVPNEIEEAAFVDGANRFVMFFRVILPLATPALVALTIFSFQGQWNNFMDALIIVGTDRDLFNLPLGLTTLRGSGQDVQFDLVLAGSVITTLPMALLFFVFQRYFVQGTAYSGLAGQ
jgi:multiple sugar transport system permease protein